MSKPISRRAILRSVAWAGTGALIPPRTFAASESGLVIAGRPVELSLSSLSAHTIRISLTPLEALARLESNDDGLLVPHTRPSLGIGTLKQSKIILLDNLKVTIAGDR